jgi:nickel/cobalt transporter (NicO) family protein
MNTELAILTGTAAAVGIVHTVIGPDHYIPFVAMAKARGWSLGRTALVTTLCGIGHVGSSVVLGFIGIALGFSLIGLENTESARGALAAWCLTAFGFAYLVWGLWRALRQRPHAHPHLHADGSTHLHDHGHADEHAHVHGADRANITPWILFTVFVLGPYEPLIPLLMYPAAIRSLWGMAAVTAVFSVATIGTMLVVVTLATYGLSFVRLRPLERYSHALAGFSILVCGVAIYFGL